MLNRRGKRMEVNSQDMTNRRSNHIVKPSVLYNNMTKNESEYSSKNNSRNLSKRNHIVYATSGRKDKNSSYHQIQKLPIARNSQRK
mmetsp:Transcript_29958/g.26523  ORF Transcript_29958/g.26523 Transcript_29958/m.26523 type:complete len:86 (+) Transcript_29958:574-831(+)